MNAINTYFGRFVQPEGQYNLIDGISHRVYALGKHTVRLCYVPYYNF